MLICLFNAKGGVSKSTCSVHLTYYLSNILKKKVSLIDADPMRISSFWVKQLDIDVTTHQLTAPDDFLEQVLASADLSSIIYAQAAIADAPDQGGVVWSMGNRASSSQKEFTAWCKKESLSR